MRASSFSSMFDRSPSDREPPKQPQLDDGLRTRSGPSGGPISQNGKNASNQRVFSDFSDATAAPQTDNAVTLVNAPISPQDLYGVEWTPDNWEKLQTQCKATMTIDRYRTDAIVVRSHAGGKDNIPPDDSTVKGIPSRKSLQRLTFLLNNCDVPMSTMTTITFQNEISDNLKVQEHKRIIESGLQKLRREGATQYAWVREHTMKGTPHWHIFHNGQSTDGVDVDKSEKWSRWVASQCWDILKVFPALRSKMAYMADGNGKDFIGCVRVEKLRSDAGGRYAGKEGAKRFQKVAPRKWQSGGRWWAASRSIVCSPIERVQVPANSLLSTTITLPDGKILDVPFKLQFSKGTRCV